MSKTIVANVIAPIEIDVEKVINAITEKYNISIFDITMDDIFQYINEGMSYLENKKANGVYPASDGYAVNCFEDHTYYKIEEYLEELKEEGNI